MTESSQPDRAPALPEDARDLQARLYREIGISAVAAALRFTTQADLEPQPATKHPLPWVLRDEDVAA